MYLVRATPPTFSGPYDPYETLHTLLGLSEDMHIVFFRILKLFFITFITFLT